MEADPPRTSTLRGRLRPRSVRVRTTLLAVLIVGVALAIGGAALVVLLRNSLTDQVRTVAELRAEDVASVLEAGTSPASVAVNDEEDLFIQIVDDQGAVVASSENIAGEPVIADLPVGRAEEVRTTPVGEHTFLVVARRAQSPTAEFTVLVGRSTDLVSESTGLVTSVLVAGLPALLLLVGATTWWIVGRTLAPVDAIRREVDEISANELHRRVPATATDDEIARLAITVNRMLDRLETSHDRQRRFVSDASHELRSPVATIRQYAEVALAHPDVTTTGELAEVVLAEDLRVQRLVEDLLLLARADERTLAVNRRPLDLDDLVFEEVSRLRVTSTVRTDVSHVSGGRVLGDRSQLQRLLRNLGDNAVRHADTTVTFVLSEQNGQVVLAVEDDGAGVAMDQRRRILERFVRLDEARARDDGGSGLGLAIVSEIVRAHAGTIEVTDSPLGGARVEIRLPAEVDS